MMEADAPRVEDTTLAGWVSEYLLVGWSQLLTVNPYTGIMGWQGGQEEQEFEKVHQDHCRCRRD
jgi:hypothetical protein